MSAKRRGVKKSRGCVVLTLHCKLVKMVIVLQVLVVLLCTLWNCEAAVEDESKVMVLTQENWDEVINNTPLIMVEFYASWWVCHMT